MIAEGMTECAQMAQEMKVSQATVSRFARKAIDAGWLKKRPKLRAYRDQKRGRKMKNSFHEIGSRFTFQGIGRKCETDRYFRSPLPITDRSESIKRERLKTEALISRKTGFVSAHFRFRFTLSTTTGTRTRPGGRSGGKRSQLMAESRA